MADDKYEKCRAAISRYQAGQRETPPEREKAPSPPEAEKDGTGRTPQVSVYDYRSMKGK